MGHPSANQLFPEMLNFFLKITINTSICTLGKSTNDINVVIKDQYKPLSILALIGRQTYKHRPTSPYI